MYLVFVCVCVYKCTNTYNHSAKRINGKMAWPRLQYTHLFHMRLSRAHIATHVDVKICEEEKIVSVHTLARDIRCCLCSCTHLFYSSI